MRYNKKKFGWVLVVFLVMSALILGGSELGYYLHLAKGQLTLPFKPIPISAYVPENEEEQKCLAAIPQVLNFAKDLGLHTEGSYERIFPDKQPLLWAVSASYQDGLRPYRWYYPFLGRLGYRGYFNVAWAQKEAADLRQRGFHVRVRPVHAWSSLGFFSEVLSPTMLSEGVGPMAETILHELFHRWYYLSGEDAWNENLAQHFGQHAALEFLKVRYGEESILYQSYVVYLHDQQQWQSFLEAEAHSFYRHTGAFYLQPGDSVFWAIRSKARRLPFLSKGKAMKVWQHHLPNLADFTTAKQYYQWSTFLNRDLALQHQGDLMKQMRFWKEKNAPPAMEVGEGQPTMPP